jgi:hypothetical protein
MNVQSNISTVERQAGEKIKSGGNHFAEADLIYSSLFFVSCNKGPNGDDVTNNIETTASLSSEPFSDFRGPEQADKYEGVNYSSRMRVALGVSIVWRRAFSVGTRHGLLAPGRGFG